LKALGGRLARTKPSARRRLIRYGILGINLLFLVLVGYFLSRPSSSQAAAGTGLLGNSKPASTLINPLDQLSSADVAETVAEVTGLPEATAVANQAQTVNAELAVTPVNNIVAAKPQVVATNYESNQNIHSYVVQPGDTVASLAVKFDVTSNSIEWSNNLASNNLITGAKLLIPPVNGIVYSVKAGDTAQSLATKFAANAAQITAFNDAEISGLTPGEMIVIPGGQIQAELAPTYNFYAQYGSNGYDFGYCTWYVASQIAVPSNWGNAASWAYYARLSGWTVSSSPSIGAIAQTPYVDYGQGHVAIVVAVSPDGSQVEIKDMNNYGDGGGWARVGEGWVPTSSFPNYLTH
jgi:surface antigen